jgi:hypothetical protein
LTDLHEAARRPVAGGFVNRAADENARGRKTRRSYWKAIRVG